MLCHEMFCFQSHENPKKPIEFVETCDDNEIGMQSFVYVCGF